MIQDVGWSPVAGVGSALESSGKSHTRRGSCERGEGIGPGPDRAISTYACGRALEGLGMPISGHPWRLASRKPLSRGQGSTLARLAHRLSMRLTTPRAVT